YNLTGFKMGTAFYIVFGAAAAVFVILCIVCCLCNRPGRVALLEAAGDRGTRKTAPRSPGEGSLDGPSATEMGMITLSRNGPPPRTFSLPENRDKLSAEEQERDVKAREPFLAANTPAGKDEFPVRRAYQKERGDELTLAKGDLVVLLRVFRDGWAEGVSRRNGGPAVFPLACLDGGVPVVLAERLRVARQ
ncbi:hypothetical protein HK405_015890, partial [Cladochytrium tenue]